MVKELYRVLEQDPYIRRFDIWTFQNRKDLEHFLSNLGRVGYPMEKSILKIQRISKRRMKRKVIHFFKGYGTLWAERDQRSGNWVAKFNPIEEDEFGTCRKDIQWEFPNLAKFNWLGHVV